MSIYILWLNLWENHSIPWKLRQVEFVWCIEHPVKSFFSQFIPSPNFHKFFLICSFLLKGNVMILIFECDLTLESSKSQFIRCIWLPICVWKKHFCKKKSFQVSTFTSEFVLLQKLRKNPIIWLKLTTNFLGMWIKYQDTSYAKQILPVSTSTDSSGFKIGWSLPEIFKIKVDTPTAGHPVLRGLKSSIISITSLEMQLF